MIMSSSSETPVKLPPGFLRFQFRLRTLLAAVLGIGVVFGLIASAWREHVRQSAPFHRQTGGVASSGGFSIRGGYLFIRAGQVPATAFALIERPGEQYLLAYLLLLRHEYSGNLIERALSNYCDGSKASTVHQFDIEGKAIDVAYDFDVATRKERLTVCGKSYDVLLGRVFFVDITKQPPVIKQLEEDIGCRFSNDVVHDYEHSLSDDMVEVLSKLHSAIGEFIETGNSDLHVSSVARARR